MDRPLPVDLADPRRRAGDLALRRLGEPGDRARRRAAGRPRDPAHQGPPQRPHLVLLPVLPAGRPLLRDAALPLGRAGALGDRNRRAPAAALLHADPRRGRDPESSSPRSRRASSCGSASSRMFAALVVLVAGLDAGAGAGVTTWPMLLAGLGMGALASQLGSVTVSSVPDEQSGEVGGLQNTITNLGISVGTALTGAIVIAALSSSFLSGVEAEPGGAGDGQVARSDQPHRRRPVPLRRRTGNGPRRSPRPAAARPTRSSKKTKPPGWSACARRSPCWRSSPWSASSSPAASRRDSPAPSRCRPVKAGSAGSDPPVQAARWAPSASKARHIAA